ncbi:tetratricopeptide repeat-containing sulfotransferase family protein [Dyella sp. A6]|uniref:tetratricopeptide repeat-containing sulfotransferase family protein n=1 Tax=Dyella aluminiiresistens TaxID=3069105 RepID=UPI002E7A25D7|nr:sulfotransferase [Dyella sp. A6]
MTDSSSASAAMPARMLEAYRHGELDRVVELGRQVRAGGRFDEETELLLGLAEHASGHVHAAITTFRALTAAQPGVFEYWNNLGQVLRQAGESGEAEAALRQACQLAPRDAELWFNLGLLYLQQHRWLPAREALLEAANLVPGFIEARLQAAYVCHVCGDSASVEALLADAHAWPPLAADDALRLSGMLSACGRWQVALDVLQRALPPAPDEAPPIALRMLAHQVLLHERGNRLAQAREYLARLPLAALDALPASALHARLDGWNAHAVMAMRERDYPVAAARYRQVLEHAADAETTATAGFGLAAACDKQGSYAEAWQALQGAHAAQVSIATETVPALLEPGSRPLDMQEHPVDRHAYAAWRTLRAPDSPQSPVFVVGFPRSGTTLLEQMIDAHPAFLSMDERPFVHELTQRMEQAGQAYPGALADLGQADVDQLRAVYAGMVAGVVPDLGQRRLVDKNPLNMLCLPMIMRLFPDARIILCLRHPCDVLLSCYMQVFRSPPFMAMCSSLQRLAEGYALAFEKWFRHVEVFAPHILEWRYESVVTRFDDQVVRLGDFLGVQDSSAMAGFAEHAHAKGFISTPSYAQVTEGINARGIGRWQAYRQHFEPVLPILQPWLQRLGYMT